MASADLRKRLTRIGVGRRPPPQPAPASPPPTSDDEFNEPAPIEAVAPGREIDTPAGPCYVIETAHPLGVRHGPFELGDLLRRPPEVAAQLSSSNGSVAIPDLERLIFLDTETTGLAGGAGTLAFLVGAGVYDGDSFRIYQYFLRDPSDEFALTAALAHLLETGSGLVTFNGRAFDVPLLESRFLLARQHFDLRVLLQLDLLHPARRLWRGRLPDCSLGTLEKEVLGVSRTEVDVPGWMIPELYAAYLRTGDAREMQRVIYHNAIDILSMVTLATYLLDVFSDPLADERSGADCLRLAVWLEAGQEPERAENAYRAALQRPLDSSSEATALRRYGAFLKRGDRRTEAVPLWGKLAEMTPDDPEPLVEIAKYYEWHARDLPRALDCTKRALECLESWPPSWKRDDVRAALRHRQARLERKYGKEASA